MAGGEVAPPSSAWTRRRHASRAIFNRLHAFSRVMRIPSFPPTGRGAPRVGSARGGRGPQKVEQPGRLQLRNVEASAWNGAGQRAASNLSLPPSSLSAQAHGRALCSIPRRRARPYVPFKVWKASSRKNTITDSVTYLSALNDPNLITRFFICVTAIVVRHG